MAWNSFDPCLTFHLVMLVQFISVKLTLKENGRMCVENAVTVVIIDLGFPLNFHICKIVYQCSAEV